MRTPIQDVYTISGIGVVPVGRVETGIMKKGDKIIFRPSIDGVGAAGEVKSIEMHHEEIPQALPGDNIGFNVSGVDKNAIRRGDVCGPVDKQPTVAKSSRHRSSCCSTRPPSRQDTPRCSTATRHRSPA